MEIVSHSETGYSGPTVANLEQLEFIDESLHLLLGKGLPKDDGEQASRSGEIAFPELVSGTRGERRMQYQFDLGAGGEPAGKLERTLRDSFQAHGKGLHSTECETAIIGRGGTAYELVRLAEFSGCSLVAHRYGSQPKD